MSQSRVNPVSGKVVMISRQRILRIISVFAFVCVLCSVIICLREIIPHYVVLSVLPPDYYQGKALGEWGSLMKSVKGTTFTRFFVFREEAVVSKDSVNGIKSWQSIIEYFDNQIGDLGWTRTEKYLPCISFLPEASFLKHGENGYVYYVRNEVVNLDNYDDGDFICLAVWKDTETTDAYNVVLVTIKPSLLTKFMSIFNL